MNEDTHGIDTLNNVQLDTTFQPPDRNAWIERALAGLGDNVTFQSIERQTLDGISIQTLYDSDPPIALQIASKNQAQWDNRFSLSAGEPVSARRDISSSLAGGATSIELYLHDPAQIAELLADVQLSIAPVSLRAGLGYESCCQALVSLASAQGISKEALQCSFNADPLGHALTLGYIDQNIEDALQQMGSFCAQSSLHYPKCKSALVDVAIHHNAGATPVQELHAAIATATLYAEYMLDAGMSIAAANRAIVFQIAMDADTLIGVAKLRALQGLWQHVLNSLGGSSDDASLTNACVVAETSYRYLSQRDPWNNHLRNLSASTAACLAGADTIIVHRHNRLSNDAEITLGQRMARNIPIILERECGLRKVSDPMGGSYAIENLTQQLMQHVWESLSAMDTCSEWLDKIGSGQWQQQLSNSQQQRIEQLDDLQIVAVGVNQFVQQEETPLTIEPVAASEKAGANVSASWIVQPLPAIRDAQHFEQKVDDAGSGL